MNFRTGLRTYLLADTSITAIVSDKIYGFPAPQDVVFPYLMLSHISDVSIQGANESTLIDNDLWQIDIYGNTYDSVASLELLIKNRLDVIHNTLFGEYLVYVSRYQGSTNTTELEDNASENRISRMSVTFNIRHKQNTEV
jgi:hypothetical protein